ncbi:MAG: DUF1772 domain-containing protein [Alphaproteobacteria bacterium]|nr:DUF1772 domain-containing protein [Alphaproteobacteria bacterium]
MSGALIGAAIDALAVATALGAALVAGVFFAFSSFVMAALGRLPAPAGIAAMQAINVTVLRFSFLGLFLGTAVGAAALVLASALRAEEPLLAAGGALYLLGCFLVTGTRNVPLNKALALAAPDSAEGAALWARYLRDWTRWNHLRTAAALVAAALILGALI